MGALLQRLNVSTRGVHAFFHFAPLAHKGLPLKLTTTGTFILALPHGPSYYGNPNSNYSILETWFLLKSVVVGCLLLSNQLLCGGSDISRIRIASYNIWNPTFEARHTGSDTWTNRLPNIVDVIRSADPDIICLQEVSLDSYSDLVSILGIEDRYLSFYHSHAKSKSDYPEGRDGLAIFVKPNLVDNVQLHTSEKALRPTYRRDLWIDVQIPGVEEKIRVATTHLDSSNNLGLGNVQLANFLADVQQNIEAISFIVVCGDFNEGEEVIERPRARMMTESSFLTDGSTASTRPEALDVRHKGHVDWIYFRKIFESLEIDVHAGKPLGDEQASDHKLIYTDFSFDVD